VDLARMEEDALIESIDTSVNVENTIPEGTVKNV